MAFELPLLLRHVRQMKNHAGRSNRCFPPFRFREFTFWLRREEIDNMWTGPVTASWGDRCLKGASGRTAFAAA
jgi:hypothetical protein